MVNLDDPEVYGKYDASGMLKQVGELSGQCSEAWRNALDLPLASAYSDIDMVVILGMGGSAIGGDLLRGLALHAGRIPVLVHRDYDLPSSVDGRTLVIASSYSGNTEETLSAFTLALGTPAKKLAVTTGGRLKALAEENNVPVLHFQYEGQPRAAFGFSFFSLLGLSQKLGIVALGPKDVDETVTLLEDAAARFDPDVPIEANPAKKLATKLSERMILVYGAGILCEVALRWKSQLNENSKNLVISECLPELNHNAVVGYEFPSWLSEKGFVVMLRCPSLHPRIVARYQVTAELLADTRIAHETIDFPGESSLAQMMGAVAFGDYVSCYLAMLNGVDPSPVRAIDYVKRRLAEVDL
jgi:glucose/mannose-6-phosphate isomerase